ncbi:cis-prenyltransferase [Puccinia graminis f. sp. tritici]|uniref:Alkyl transferase n=1 Tax=Puccinia graminis f. sp. tritici TaxID=56615 RepID=A0A5B0QC11_PUCGR|nr:cis-prenyltransferase [Puccinia graminis f. sp. tritici]
MRIKLPTTTSSILSILSKLIPPFLYPSMRILLIRTLQLGPLPNHVGFIMDGNRRFSRSVGLPVEDGHRAGFEALKRILELLLRLEVPNVTVYAFAIGNFKRSAEEVNKLMDLARTKLVQICEKGQLLDRYGIRVVVIGRKDLLPPDIKESVCKVEEMTINNKRGCLNVAFPYSSQEEMASAIYKTAQDSISDQTPTSLIDIDTIDKNLYTSHSPPLDILIRTSGVSRLSDFLLWQTTLNSSEYEPSSTTTAADPTKNLISPIEPEEAKKEDGLGSARVRNTTKGPSVHFVPKFWPDFGILDVLPILLGWQAEEIFLRFAPFFH